MALHELDGPNVWSHLLSGEQPDDIELDLLLAAFGWNGGEAGGPPVTFRYPPRLRTFRIAIGSAASAMSRPPSTRTWRPGIASGAPRLTPCGSWRASSSHCCHGPGPAGATTVGPRQATLTSSRKRKRQSGTAGWTRSSALSPKLTCRLPRRSPQTLPRPSHGVAAADCARPLCARGRPTGDLSGASSLPTRGASTCAASKTFSPT